MSIYVLCEKPLLNEVEKRKESSKDERERERLSNPETFFLFFCSIV